MNKLKMKLDLLLYAILNFRKPTNTSIAEIEFGEIKGDQFIKAFSFRPHSYVGNWLQLIRGKFAETTQTITDNGGTPQSVPMGGYAYTHPALGAGALAANNAYGVQFGTGTNAVQVTDYMLQTLIANGSGAGQLTYGATTVEAAVVVGNVSSFKIIRPVTNNTASPITVYECGLSLKVEIASSVYCYILVERTVLGTPYVVAAGATAYGRYTIRVTT